MSLSTKHCVPCEGGTPPLSHEEVKKYLQELKNEWENLGDKKIRREFKFSAKGHSTLRVSDSMSGSPPAEIWRAGTSGGKSPFKAAMEFVNRVAELAESEGHHPDLHIFYNRVVIELWTHAVNGLSENDFILAAKIEKIVSS